MKPIPQFELPIPDEPFALVPERSEDGDRIAREQQQSAADRAAADQLQSSLRNLNPSAVTTTP